MAEIIKTENFEEKVLKAERPVLVDFYADWCGPCKMMIPIFEKLSAEYAGRVDFYKLNTDKDGALAAQYRVMSIPTMILFVNGEEKERVVGAVPEATLRGKLEEV
ncbi:MAG: thioredoxin [Clostridia bacterium]|nr:thioredoxin [Clostridia bacterium]